jgi:hypothetical protein
MEASHLSKSEQGDDGSIEIPLTQRTANMSPKDADPSPSIARAPVDPLPEVAYLLDDSVAPLAASPMKHSSPTGPSPQDVPPPLVGSSPSSMDDESDSEHSDSASTVSLVGHDAEVGLTSELKSDEDDYVLARTASTSRSDMEVAESIG